MAHNCLKFLETLTWAQSHCPWQHIPSSQAHCSRCWDQPNPPELWHLAARIQIDCSPSSLLRSFSIQGFSISPSNEYSELISFEIDLFDLLAVQGTLKGLLQHHNWKASLLQHSAFFMVQCSQPYGTTEKTIALTIWTFVSKVMSLLFNTLSRFVIAFLPRSNHFLISWLQSPSSVILEHMLVCFNGFSHLLPVLAHPIGIPVTIS